MAEPKSTRPVMQEGRTPLLAITALVAIAVAGGIAFAATHSGPPARPAAAKIAKPAGGCKQVTASGLGWTMLSQKAAASPKPTDNDVTLVNYRGTLLNGTEFDKNDGAAFPVAQVVPGFGEGLKLMTRGSRFRFCIPPALGYGAQAKGPIPANSTLIFEVDLIDFQSMDEMRAMQDAQTSPAPSE